MTKYPEKDVVIRAEGLGKKYLIGHEGERERYTALRDVASRTVKSFVRSTRDMMQGRQLILGDEIEEFWALKDINFEIKRGDVVGIIGRNGAGKSTLLKVLSRITEPSEGRIEIKGRVASLLEVGTGFHPELTGRENIFLNGAILGMSRIEIKRKFAEIVDFAGVEKFLDTPVKRYSSGMYVRLAFAVAAHLEPEILVVDEVLAVGDAEFQKKCLGKMQDVANQGRTVLFVSHNLQSIANLCRSAIKLQSGELEAYSEDVSYIIDSYINISTVGKTSWQGTSPKNAEWVEINQVSLGQPNRSNYSVQSGVFRNDAPIELTVDGKIIKENSALTIGIALYDEKNSLLFWSYTTDVEENKWPSLDIGAFTLNAAIPKRLLNAGTYRIEFIAGLHFISWILEPNQSDVQIYFKVDGGLSDSPLWKSKRPGIIAPIIDWKNAK